MPLGSLGQYIHTMALGSLAMVESHGPVLLDKHLHGSVRSQLRGLQLLLAEGVLPMFSDVLCDGCPLVGVATGRGHWVLKQLLCEGASEVVRTGILAS